MRTPRKRRSAWCDRASVLATFWVVALAVDPTPAPGQSPALEQAPADWLLTGEDADRYELIQDTEVVRSGSASKRISAKGNRRRNDWAVSVQMVDATRFRGQRIRLSGHLRSDDLGSGGLWLRVDGIVDQTAAQIVIDNTEDRRLEGTSDWTVQDIVVDIPAESVTILFGAMIVGDGTLWVDDLSLEEVSMDAQVTVEGDPVELGGEYSRPPGVLPTPSNLDFERGSGTDEMSAGAGR